MPRHPFLPMWKGGSFWEIGGRLGGVSVPRGRRRGFVWRFVLWAFGGRWLCESDRGGDGSGCGPCAWIESILWPI